MNQTKSAGLLRTVSFKNCAPFCNLAKQLEISCSDTAKKTDIFLLYSKRSVGLSMCLLRISDTCILDKLPCPRTWRSTKIDFKLNICRFNVSVVKT